MEPQHERGSRTYWVCPTCELWFTDDEPCDGHSFWINYNPTNTHPRVDTVPRELVELRKGDRIRIPAGTRIVCDMNPSSDKASYSARAQTVRLNHCGNRAGRPTVWWAGAGGYWREAYADEVTLVD